MGKNSTVTEASIMCLYAGQYKMCDSYSSHHTPTLWHAPSDILGQNNTNPYRLINL